MTKIRANQTEIEEILNDPSASATELKLGTVQIATQVIVDAGTDAFQSITPATLSSAILTQGGTLYEPADATILKDLDIGVTVQAFDATILVDADIGVTVAAESHNHTGVYEPADNTILKAIITTPETGHVLTYTAGGDWVNTNSINIQINGTLVVTTASYETLVTSNNHIPNKKYVDDAIGTGIGATALGQLSDVDLGGSPALQDGYVLTYSTTGSPVVWKQRPIPSSALNELTDVVAGSPTTNQVLTFNGTNWVNAPSPGGLFTEDANANIVGGTGAGSSLLSSAYNNFLAGYNAGDSITIGDLNVAIGAYAGTNITLTTHNVAVGAYAMNRPDATTSGGFNVAIGSNAGRAINNLNSIQNTFIGANSGNSTAASGQLVRFNVVAGYAAMSSMYGGDSNVAIGKFAITNLNNADSNIGVGESALRTLVNGNFNVVLGHSSGYWLGGTSSSNICIGPNAGPASAVTLSNKLFINNAASDTPLIGGDFSTADITINGNFTVTGTTTGVALTNLDDVALGSPITDQVLTFNGTNWVNQTPESGITDHTLLSNIGTNTHAQIDTHISDTTIHFSTLDGLSDVVFGSPITDEVLTFNGTNWINQTPTTGVTTAYVDAKTVINWDRAFQIGTSHTVVSNNVPAMAALNSTDIAFFDTGNDDLRTYRWNEDVGIWHQIGNDLPLASTNIPAMTALNSTDIAFVDDLSDTLRTYRWTEGTGTWAQVGNSLAITTITTPSITALNGTDIAYVDAANDELRTYSFDGTDWSQVNNSLTITSVTYPAITALNETDIAYVDEAGDEIRTYRWDGTDWAQEGTGLGIGAVSNPAITSLNENDIVYIDDSNDEIRTYRWDGTNWAQIGTNLRITGVLNTPAITPLNGTDIAYIDAGNDELRTYRFGATIGYPDMASVLESRYSASLISSELEGWNLHGAQFDLNDADLSGQLTTVGGLHFSADGTELYVIRNELDDVFHYTLSVGWDLSSAVFANQKITIVETTNIKDVHLDTTGTKMYLLEEVPGTVFQYTLGTAWDVSTATYDSVSYTIPTVTSAVGFDFKADGTLFFMTNLGDDSVYAIRMLTPWDLSTALYRGDKAKWTGIIEGRVADIAFSANGRTMFMAGEESDTIYSFGLSEPWNLFTMAYDERSFRVFSEGLGGMAGIFVKPDGTKLYIADSGESTIFQFDVSGNTTVPAATETETGIVELATQAEVELGVFADRVVTTKTLSNWNALPLTQFTNSGWELSNASFDNIGYAFGDAHDSNTAVYGMHFSPDGLNLYTTEAVSTTPNVYQHVLEVPFDIQSISSIQTIGLLEGSGPRGIHMSPDGTKFWTVDTSADIYQYTLSPAFDITTATAGSPVVTFNPIAPTIGRDIYFRPDGLAFFILSQTIIYEFTISTPWDLTTTPVAGTTFSLVPHGTGSLYHTGITFNTDGTKMISLSADHGAEGLYSFTLGTAWDVSTAAYDTDSYFSTIPEDNNPTGMVANATGTKIFVAGTGAAIDVIGQYSTAGAASIVSASETVEGVLELATQAEVDAGTDALRAVTPATLAATPAAPVKPTYESIVVAGSPVSDVINTSISTVALTGSPDLFAGVLVFRNGGQQTEGIMAGSPLEPTEDFAVTGANQITFGTGVLEIGNKINIYVFG